MALSGRESSSVCRTANGFRCSAVGSAHICSYATYAPTKNIRQRNNFFICQPFFPPDLFHFSETIFTHSFSIDSKRTISKLVLWRLDLPMTPSPSREVADEKDAGLPWGWLLLFLGPAAGAWRASRAPSGCRRRAATAAPKCWPRRPAPPPSASRTCPNSATVHRWRNMERFSRDSTQPINRPACRVWYWKI